MKPKRKNILSIAGFDPSGGAGILADIKTITAIKGYGLSVCTANTIQTDMSFIECHWSEQDTILKQLKLILEQFKIETIKIGIIENTTVLERAVDLIEQIQPRTKVILDPVLRSSSDFNFHKKSLITPEILKRIYLITPNLEEIKKISTRELLEQQCTELQEYTNVYLKGGHSNDPKKIGIDYLYTKDQKAYTLKPKKNQNYYEKHGSGCIFSSAVSTYIAKGYPLLKACLKAKRYTEIKLASSKGLLAIH